MVAHQRWLIVPDGGPTIKHNISRPTSFPNLRVYSFCQCYIILRRWIVYSRSPATEINCAQFGVKSQFADLPAVYTSSLPYLTHICEDFLLLERESKFMFMLFIRNYTWGYQVISGGVGWEREILWDDVIARGRWRHRTWYLPFFLWSTSLRRSEHALSADEFSSHRCRSCRTGEGWCKLYRREL